MGQSNEFRNERRARWLAEGLCGTCGKRAPEHEGARSCNHCRGYSRTLRRKRSRGGRCKRCGGETEPGKKSCELCLAKARAYNARVRDEVFAAYGGYRCSCPGCTETTPEFLQIDHINDDGAEHRRLINRRKGGMYHWLRKHGYPPGFQVLCANCNYAKGFWGYCPHWSDTEVANAKSRNQNRRPRPQRDRPPA